ncbi:hypothetical protein ACTFIT_012304 [Dictyostelium discoideum]
MEGIKNLPSMVKQGYYMVKLDIKKAYLHVLVDPQYRDLFRFVWKGSHYRWKTRPFGLSTAPRIFTMLLRPVLRMFYSNVFTVPKPGTNLPRPVLDLKRLNTYINNQSFKMEGIKNLPSMVKQGYYMVKLDIKKAYLHVLHSEEKTTFKFALN